VFEHSVRNAEVLVDYAVFVPGRPTPSGAEAGPTGSTVFASGESKGTNRRWWQAEGFWERSQAVVDKSVQLRSCGCSVHWSMKSPHDSGKRDVT
jgi:hypothetical protein